MPPLNRLVRYSYDAPPPSGVKFVAGRRGSHHYSVCAVLDSRRRERGVRTDVEIVKHWVSILAPVLTGE
jgi:hypothetical protein